jgi:hypothetical protein
MRRFHTPQAIAECPDSDISHKRVLQMCLRCGAIRVAGTNAKSIAMGQVLQAFPTHYTRWVALIKMDYLIQGHTVRGNPPRPYCTDEASPKWN